VWARGIPDYCAPRRVSVLLNDFVLPAVFVSESGREGFKQVNAMLPAGFGAGPATIRLQCDSEISGPAAVELIR
jgi:hypothetical protein